MTLIKVKRNHEMPTVFNNMLDNFFGKDFIPSVLDNEWTKTQPAVNVIDAKDNFRIEVAAPGLKKDDFKLNVEGDLLTISSEKETENKVEGENLTTLNSAAHSPYRKPLTQKKYLLNMLMEF